MAFAFCQLPPTRYGVKNTRSNLIAALIFMMAGFFSGATAKAEPVTIAALGDSLVQGYGLRLGDGFVPQLENWLAARGLEVVLINAGVSGDTTAGGLARADWTMTPDVDALIVSLGGNDVLRGIDPAVTRANLDQILSRAAARSLPVLLVGILAPGNFGADYKKQFDTIFPDLAAKYDVDLYPSFIQVLSDMPDRSAVLANYFQADNIHPNADGIALIVDDLGPKVADLAARAATGR